MVFTGAVNLGTGRAKLMAHSENVQILWIGSPQAIKHLPSFSIVENNLFQNDFFNTLRNLIDGHEHLI
jgi:hypothetical protein